MSSLKATVQQIYSLYNIFLIKFRLVFSLKKAYLHCRVMKHYDGWMKKGIIILNTNSGTDYVFPHECCVMINVIIDCKAQVILSITLFLVYLVVCLTNLT